MVGRIGVFALLALLVGGGIAVGAAQTTTSDSGVAVCVNDVTGLMRASAECRENESSMMLGGGSDVSVSQEGTLTVPVGAEAIAKTLPITGVTITPKQCLAIPPEYGQAINPRVLLAARTGETIDVYYSGYGTKGATSYLLPPVGGMNLQYTGPTNYGVHTVVVKASSGTATLFIAGSADWNAQTCTFVWQAIEMPA